MKRINYIIILLIMVVPVFSQTTTENYIVKKTYTQNDNTTAISQIQYFDGLGRPVETIQRGITPTGADLVSGIEYDGFGREYRHWLPGAAAGNNGAYVSDFGTKATSTNGGDTKPYAETILESSPLSRPLGQRQPGADWYSHPTGIDYKTNDGSILCFYVNSSNQLAKDGNYASGSLYVTKVTDEDGNVGYEFKDKLDRVILKRQKLDGDNVDTYYVYNDLNQLCYVLPPKAVDQLSSDLGDNNTIMRQYSYLYKYDTRGNCTYKRLPGCEPIYMGYDKANRLVISQDGNQRLINQWTITKYDVLGRMIYTSEGLFPMTYEECKVALKDMVVTETFSTGNQSYPVFDTGYSKNYYHLRCTKLYTVNYYDDYQFLEKLPNAIKNTLAYDSSKEQEFGAKYSSAKGLLTGMRTYLLDGSGQYITTAIYYDYRGGVLQIRSTNHLGGYDITYNAMNFSGSPTKTYKIHGINGASATITELYTFNYDHALRPTTTTYSLNGGSTVTLASNTYDDLGRLQTKKRHTNADTESYAYNVRSWPTNITSGSFIEKLYYNTNPINANLSFNGNISYSTWTYNNGSTVEKAYSYQYDGLNRLKTAEFKQGTSTQGSGSFDETFTYDKMGNILSLQRKKNYTTIDNLSFNYTGNQINYISDAGGSQSSYSIKEYQNKSTATSGEMTYDANGNMVKDLDRDIVDIRYNILNLPDTISFSNGNLIVNRYNAGGQKLSSRYLTNTTRVVTPLLMTPNNQVVSSSRLNATELNGETLTARDGFRPPTTPPEQEYPIEQEMPLYRGNETNYIGNYEYDSNVVVYTTEMFRQSYNLARIFNPEGYVTTVTNPQYYYYRRDHLGNTREVWLANTNTTVQRTQYYPSGLPWADGIGAGEQNKKYNGKEFVEMHGYDAYDYGARGMYAAIGRWTAIDPLAEKYYSISPYAYCGGDPVNRFDPNGMDWYQDDNGNVVWQEGDAETITLKDITYKRIGAEFTEKIDENTSISYTQNKVTSITINTMTKDEWISQFDDRFGDKKQQNKACNKASDAMLANEDVKSAGMVIVVNDGGNGRAGTANGTAENAIDKMSTALDFGIPTKVNVDYRVKSSSGDGMGDHFIVVQGKTETINNGNVTSTIFNFFDPGTRYPDKGTASSNTLSIMNRTLVGSHINNGMPIVVTSIRPSR